MNTDKSIELPLSAAAERGIYIYTVLRGMMIRGYDSFKRGDIVVCQRRGG